METEVASSSAICFRAAGDASSTLEQNLASSLSAIENNDQNHPFLRAIGYDLVMDKITSYINFEDMKVLSAVSKNCLEAVRKTKAFSDKARLMVCKEVISLEVFKESTYPWKNLSWDLSIPIEVVDLIADILEFVKSLSLRVAPCAVLNLKEKDVVDYLTSIFLKTKNLTELELDVVILNHILHNVFSSVEVQQLISNLQSLDIRGYPARKESVYYLVDPMTCGQEEQDDSDSPFQRNFLQLAQIPLKLKKFVFGKIMTSIEDDLEPFKFIPQIVSACKDTLEELELHLKVWGFEEMEVIRCPKLKRLTLTAKGNNAKRVETFIKNQPPLEELNIEIEQNFPMRLLLSLQGLLARAKKLHLKAKRFEGTSEPVDWEFLGTLSKLEDFYLRKPFIWDDSEAEIYGVGESIVEKLPCATKKISMIGLNPFWRDPYEVPFGSNIGHLVARFSDLIDLDLTRTHGAVTDEGLQSLIKNCPQLTRLAFSHCPDVTDFGISGVRKINDENSDEEGNQAAQDLLAVSLRDLKGLLHLKIRSCPNINPECMLDVVQFKFLRSFDYYKNVQLPKEFLLQIVLQNPCLEKVWIHIGSYDHDVDYLADLKKEVKNLNPRVHFLEILEQTDWEEHDSDCDADDNSWHGGDGDSDISGGGGHYDYDDVDDFVDYDDDYYDYASDEDGEGYDYN